MAMAVYIEQNWYKIGRLSDTLALRHMRLVGSDFVCATTTVLEVITSSVAICPPFSNLTLSDLQPHACRG